MRTAFSSTIFRLCAFALLVQFSLLKTEAQVTESDSLALVALYNSTDGANWTNNTNWLTGSVSDWYGITVEGGRVSVISLINNNLDGEIPPSVGDLSELINLRLGGNNLYGAIPIELNFLNNLKTLSLSINKLTGSIPSEIGNITSLEVLNLGVNMLTGSIPVELGNLLNLRGLYLGVNNLSGVIPVELGNLTHLTHLSVYMNQLTGVIPSELGNLTSVISFGASNNKLSGTIPIEIGDLTKLGVFSVSDNQLTGSIPEEINNINNPNLSGIYLQNNQLEGTLPSTFANLVDLDRLNIRENNLSGLPELTNLSNLIEFDVSWNIIPQEDIDLNASVITNNEGQYLPVNETDSLALVALYNATKGDNWINNTNWLQGYVRSWDGITIEEGRVVRITLRLNNLTGYIPSELGDLTDLEYLTLRDNQLSGSIPNELGNLTALGFLFLRHNQLTGEIPEELENLSNLRTLDLRNNQLTGTISSELENLTNLTNLWIYNNIGLRGSIPGTFENLDLNIFQFYGTNLCEPDTESYDSWKSTVGNYVGTEVGCEDQSLIIWTGTTNTNWNTTTNWESEVVPTELDNVIIPDVSETSMNDPVLSGDFEVNDIHVESGGSLTIETGSSLAVFGTASGNNYHVLKEGSNVVGGDDALGSGGYNLMGSPIANENLNSAHFSHVDYAYSYDGISYSSNLAGTDHEMTAGQGYFLGQDDSSPYFEFQGTINSGEIEIDLVNPSEFHMVSNPYAAAISRSEFLAENGTDVIDGALYFWDDGGTNNGADRAGVYVTVDAAGNVVNGTFDGNIRSAQGFWIHTATSPLVSFTPSMQTTSADANSDAGFYRTTETAEYIRLKLTNGSQSDELLINLEDQATFELDPGFDVHKLMNPGINFYSLMGNEAFTIQAIPQNESIINLGYNLKEFSTYQLVIDEVGTELEVRLIDELTGETYDLKQQNQIEFTTTETKNDTRFKLQINSKTVTSLKELAGGLKLEVSSNRVTLRLQQEVLTSTEVGLYNLVGQELYRGELTFTNGEAEISGLNLQEGNLYLLKFTNFEPIKFILE